MEWGARLKASAEACRRGGGKTRARSPRQGRKEINPGQVKAGEVNAKAVVANLRQSALML